MTLRKRVQMIFQDPYESLNGRQTVYEIVGEPLDIHGLCKTSIEKKERITSVLETCGLAPADHFIKRRPAELSGGQRQRLVIASGLVIEPEFLVADEPVSMLDVSIRAEILNLLHTLRRDKGISILYTTHDLATAGYFTDRMAVMYLGRIVEIGPTKTILTNPLHPYTRALVSVVPSPRASKKREKIILAGEIPDPTNIPLGCRFHPRCPMAKAECRTIDPELKEISPGHQTACILVNQG